MHAQQARDLASYNRWMNERLYAMCAELSEAERQEDRGVFFKSIHGTLNHLLLADKIWLARFTGKTFHVSGLDQELHSAFDALRDDRKATDEEIVQWADSLTEDKLSGTLEYTSISNPEPRSFDMWFAVTHFFNHQTHHRGQLTALLSQCGKDYGVTDLIALPQAVLRNAT
ncbi:DinB family protein [Billgrantia antri]|uniref:DinB family protein n=1 Tax=Billgrantia antri TaxID=2846777 RepID=A0ABS6ZMM0_9GAMM|nr:DinB family protein [Halomonas antri]MBW6391332.1 DinB family protein [Halomonas antri]